MSLLTDSAFWTTVTDPNLYQGTLRDATPLTFAAVGGVISERSGVVNIAMEGMMLTGAFFAVVFALLSGNAAIGMLAAMITGGIMALILAFGAIQLRADQIVLGIAVNLIALGLTSYLDFEKFPQGTPAACVSVCGKHDLRTVSGWPNPHLENLPAIGTIFSHWPMIHLDSIPLIGSIFLQQNPITYLSMLTVILVWAFLFRTTLGLRIRAVGEHPRAADTAGINVQALRYLSVALSGVLSGIAGGYLSLAVAAGFSDNMTNGSGFIALAAMIFGKWNPFGAFGACLLFGFGQALYVDIQNTSGALQDYSVLVATLPYLLTIVALAGFIGRAIPPAADGIPYDPAAGA